MITTVRSGRISRPFAEKIMLVVTRVNGCRYCAYGHTRWALQSGVSEQEIEKLLGLEIDHFPPEQAVALAYAQHYAESGRRPDPAAEKRFRDTYGPQTSRDIQNWIRLITVGNLAGNAVDAFLSRLRGRPAQGSRWYSELVMFLLLGPFLLPLLPLLKRSPYDHSF